MYIFNNHVVYICTISNIYTHSGLVMAQGTSTTSTHQVPDTGVGESISQFIIGAKHHHSHTQTHATRP
jgi:hypothetical protein